MLVNEIMKHQEMIFPRVMYFIRTNDLVRKTFKEVRKEVSNEFYKHHVEYGKEGFLSERTYLDNIKRKINIETKVRIETNSCTKVVDVVAVRDFASITKFEKDCKNFIKWIE